MCDQTSDEHGYDGRVATSRKGRKMNAMTDLIRSRWVMRARALPIAASCAVLILGLAACGGSGSKTSSSTTAPSGGPFKAAIVTDTAGRQRPVVQPPGEPGPEQGQVDPASAGQTFHLQVQPGLPPEHGLRRPGRLSGDRRQRLPARDRPEHGCPAVPDTKWAIVDFPQAALTDKPKNVVGLTFKSEESGYLVGYLAALMTKREGGKQVVSAVGGQKIPSVDNWIAGDRAGARKANPKIKVLIDYSNQFPPSAAPKCKELALKQIAAGSHAVFQVAGGCGLKVPLDAAKAKGKLGHRRRRRPVLPRPAHPDVGGEACRHGHARRSSSRRSRAG